MQEGCRVRACSPFPSPYEWSRIIERERGGGREREDEDHDDDRALVRWCCRVVYNSRRASRISEITSALARDHRWKTVDRAREIYEENSATRDREGTGFAETRKTEEREDAATANVGRFAGRCEKRDCEKYRVVRSSENL